MLSPRCVSSSAPGAHEWHLWATATNEFLLALRLQSPSSICRRGTLMLPMRMGDSRSNNCARMQPFNTPFTTQQGAMCTASVGQLRWRMARMRHDGPQPVIPPNGVHVSLVCVSEPAREKLSVGRRFSRTSPGHLGRARASSGVEPEGPGDPDTRQSPRLFRVPGEPRLRPFSLDLSSRDWSSPTPAGAVMDANGPKTWPTHL